MQIFYSVVATSLKNTNNFAFNENPIYEIAFLPEMHKKRSSEEEKLFSGANK